MKNLKIIVVSLLLMLLPVITLAGPVEIWSVGQNAETFKVVCSSTTATEIRPANVKRLEFRLFNPALDGLVYISTYAATASTDLYPIATASQTSLFGVNPYTGAIYGLSGKDNATITIRGWETTR